jgi:hypothetical protein
MRKAILIGILFLVIGCDSDSEDSEIVNLRINHYQHPATGFVPMLAFLFQEDKSIGGDDWLPFYYTIQNFEYELGYVYDIRVMKRRIENPPIDAPGEEYTLLSVISKQKVPDNTPFEIRLTRYYSFGDVIESFVTDDVNTGFRLLSRTPVDCESLCEDLSAKLNEPKGLFGTFQHQEGAIRLVSLRQE